MLRALGPGSVSSVLKIGLDVLHVLLCVALIVLVILLFALLILQPFIQGQPGDAFFSELRTAGTDGEIEDLTVNGRALSTEEVISAARSAAVPLACGVLALFVGMLVLVTGRLRQVFLTLTRGDPFHPQNARRLRLIGFALAAFEVLDQVASDLVFMFLPAGLSDHRLDVNFSLTAWFSIAVVLVLAEVFREGARLRREAELTI